MKRILLTICCIIAMMIPTFAVLDEIEVKHIESIELTEASKARLLEIEEELDAFDQLNKLIPLGDASLLVRPPTQVAILGDISFSGKYNYFKYDFDPMHFANALNQYIDDIPYSEPSVTAYDMVFRNNKVKIEVLNIPGYISEAMMVLFFEEALEILDLEYKLSGILLLLGFWMTLFLSLYLLTLKKEVVTTLLAILFIASSILCLIFGTLSFVGPLILK